MNVGKSVLVMFSLLMVAVGCSTNGRKVACTGENWRQMGYDLASEGESVRRFDRYRDQCGDGLEDGAMSAYLDGYSEGLVEHCTYDHGYNRGFNNQAPIKVCPTEMRALYMKGYTEGKNVRERRVAEMERRSKRWDQDQGREDFREDLGGPGNANEI